MKGSDWVTVTTQSIDIPYLEVSGGSNLRGEHEVEGERLGEVVASDRRLHVEANKHLVMGR